MCSYITNKSRVIGRYLPNLVPNLPIMIFMRRLENRKSLFVFLLGKIMGYLGRIQIRTVTYRSVGVTCL